MFGSPFTKIEAHGARKKQQQQQQQHSSNSNSSDGSRSSTWYTEEEIREWKLFQAHGALSKIKLYSPTARSEK